MRFKYTLEELLEGSIKKESQKRKRGNGKAKAEKEEVATSGEVPTSLWGTIKLDPGVPTTDLEVDGPLRGWGWLRPSR